MPSSHHCKADEIAGIAIQTHVKWRYRIITGRHHRSHTSAPSDQQPRKAHMSRGAAVLCADTHGRRRLNASLVQ